MIKKETILEEADRVTSGDRNMNYGEPENNFKYIARLWDAYLANKIEMGLQKSNGLIISKEDVPAMMILMKIARQQNSHKRDNLVDIIGYTKNLATIKGEK